MSLRIRTEEMVAYLQRQKDIAENAIGEIVFGGGER